LSGTWRHSEIRQQESNFDTMTIQEETDNGTKYTTTDLKQSNNTSDVQDFYLVFDKGTKYTEYKVGMGMTFDFNLSNDTIYSDGQPQYKIIDINDERLELKKLRTGKTVEYIRSNDDLSKLTLLQ